LPHFLSRNEKQFGIGAETPDFEGLLACGRDVVFAFDLTLFRSDSLAIFYSCRFTLSVHSD
jgi:hypothetical protein